MVSVKVAGTEVAKAIIRNEVYNFAGSNVNIWHVSLYTQGIWVIDSPDFAHEYEAEAWIKANLNISFVEI